MRKNPQRALLCVTRFIKFKLPEDQVQNFWMLLETLLVERANEYCEREKTENTEMQRKNYIDFQVGRKNKHVNTKKLALLFLGEIKRGEKEKYNRMTPL